MRPPCKNCVDRCAIPNCHMTCKRYIDWKTEEAIAKEQFKQRNQAPLHKIQIKGWY